MPLIDTALNLLIALYYIVYFSPKIFVTVPGTSENALNIEEVLTAKLAWDNNKRRATSKAGVSPGLHWSLSCPEAEVEYLKNVSA